MWNAQLLNGGAEDSGDQVEKGQPQLQSDEVAASAEEVVATDKPVEEQPVVVVAEEVPVVAVEGEGDDAKEKESEVILHLLSFLFIIIMYILKWIYTLYNPG